MRKRILLVFVLFSFCFTLNVKAKTAEERLLEAKEILENYSFDFKHVNIEENIMLIKNHKPEIEQNNSLKRSFYRGLVRNDLEALIDFESDDGIDIFCYKKGEEYTESITGFKSVIADTDLCEIGYYVNTSNNPSEHIYDGVQVTVRGNFTEVDGNHDYKAESMNVIKEILNDVYISDVDMFNHYLNYGSSSSTFFEGNNALREFANLKKIVEENPEYNFFVGYEDTRRGDVYVTFAEGSTYIEKDGIIYGFTLNTYNCHNMFFVPPGTSKGDYAKVLEQRLKDYVNDDSVSIKVLSYDEGDFNFDPYKSANISYLLKDLLNISVKDYYSLVGTNYDKEKAKIEDPNFGCTDNSNECIAMFTYYLEINGKQYEIGITELDQTNINKFGTVLSVDKKSGIILRTSSGNVPLDASLLVNNYDLTEDELNYLKGNGYKEVSSYNLQLYSVMLDKIISQFNNASEILIPANGLDISKLKVLYLSDDMENSEVYSVKEVVLNGEKYISFSTNHFSNYILAEDISVNPKTFDNIATYIIVGFVSLSALTISSVIYFKRKKNN